MRGPAARVARPGERARVVRPAAWVARPAARARPVRARARAGGGAGGTGGARPTVTAAPGTTLIKINSAARRQTFEGWGTSLCWWANHVGGWAAEGRDAVVDAVVDPANGLGFNIFRYNIGGGENPAHEHMDQWREMPGFQTADGAWTWDADANQRAVLAADRRAPRRQRHPRGVLELAAVLDDEERLRLGQQRRHATT